MISRQIPRRRLLPAALLLALGAALSLPSAAFAHAIIVSSKPAANSEVPQGPVDILLQYNSRIDATHSRVSLVDPAGKVTALNVAGGSVAGSLTATGTTDAPGKWIIRWQVLSIDGHITRGDIPFQTVAKTTP
ncbi:MAG TPA: copper resistance CopC family protein [Dongiaceae bacterium]|nr:copper resistance CopC family protein [Dongiaceae bacterium]